MVEGRRCDPLSKNAREIRDPGPTGGKSVKRRSHFRHKVMPASETRSSFPFPASSRVKRGLRAKQASEVNKTKRHLKPASSTYQAMLSGSC